MTSVGKAKIYENMRELAYASYRRGQYSLACDLYSEIINDGHASINDCRSFLSTVKLAGSEEKYASNVIVARQKVSISQVAPNIVDNLKRRGHNLI